MNVKHWSTIQRALVALACGAALVSSPSLARALTCGLGWVTAPVDGETNVPTNTLIWGYGDLYRGPRVRLFGPDGEVALTLRHYEHHNDWGVGRAPVLTPSEELLPDTEYEIRSDAPDREYTHSSFFTTGPGAALTTPELPEITAREPTIGWRWGYPAPYALKDPESVPDYWRLAARRGQRLELSFDGLLMVDRFREGDVGELSKNLEQAGVLGEVRSIEDLLLPEGAPGDGRQAEPGAPAVGWSARQSSVTVSNGDCSYWPQEAADRIHVRLGVMDLAGNFSGWTSDVFEIPSVEEARAQLEPQLCASEEFSGPQRPPYCAEDVVAPPAEPVASQGSPPEQGEGRKAEVAPPELPADPTELPVATAARDQPARIPSPTESAGGSCRFSPRGWPGGGLGLWLTAAIGLLLSARRVRGRRSA